MRHLRILLTALLIGWFVSFAVAGVDASWFIHQLNQVETGQVDSDDDNPAIGIFLIGRFVWTWSVAFVPSVCITWLALQYIRTMKKPAQAENLE
jgi:hypothetical protein